jgi:hypothetical protein
MTESAVLPSLHNRHPTSTKDRRHGAREALIEMKGRDCAAGVDDGSLDFLATELSEQMMHELAIRWVPAAMGSPTSTKLAVMAERFYLEAAVAALDAEGPTTTGSVK